ncbi:MAG: hypothetical protein QXF09_00895 [Nitrososphaerota archaeon]
MTKKKIRFELIDENGDKLTLIFEGRINREKILQLADFIELYGGNIEENILSKEENKFHRLIKVIEKYFPFGYFSSKELYEAYLLEYHQPLPLSTISTYLSRLSNKGILQRIGQGVHLKYRINRTSYNEEVEGKKEGGKSIV